MSEQQPLFYDDIYEATRATVYALGGPKKVGKMLWPEKAEDKAGEAMTACLNRKRDERLDQEQVLFIKREAHKIGCHILAAFENQECHYAPPQPIEPEDERAALQRAYIESVRAQRQIADRLEKLGGGS